jgi:hypothetical protein
LYEAPLQNAEKGRSTVDQLLAGVSHSIVICNDVLQVLMKPVR